MPEVADNVLSEAIPPLHEGVPAPPLLRSGTTSDMRRAAVTLVLEASESEIDDMGCDDIKEESGGGVATTALDVGCGEKNSTIKPGGSDNVTSQTIIGDTRNTRSESQVGAFRVSGMFPRSREDEDSVGGGSHTNAESNLSSTADNGRTTGFFIDSASGGGPTADLGPAPPEFSLAADLAEGIDPLLHSSPAEMGLDISRSVPLAAASTDVRASLVKDTDDLDVERAVREQIIRDAVVADVVEEEKVFVGGGACRSGRVCVAAVLGLVLVTALTIGLSLHFTGRQRDDISGDSTTIASGPTAAPTVTPPALPTLENVVGNGYIRCGVFDGAVGFAMTNQNSGRVEGFSADLCRGVAAMVLGDPNRVEFIPATSPNRFDLLKTATIDVLSQTTTATMERDVLESTTGSGFSFSTPFHYSGLGFGGFPEFVDCAEQKNPFYDNCRNLRICVGSGSTHEYELLRTFPGPSVLSLGTPVEMMEALSLGECNVIADHGVNLLLIAQRLRDDDERDDTFELGTRLFTRDPLCLVTVDNDPEWRTLVDLVINILITAEAKNITQGTVDAWRINQLQSTILSETLIRRVTDVISAIGNLGELHERHLSVVERAKVNLVGADASSNTGLLNPHPFGDFTVKGAKPTGRMASVIDAGHVRCAIVGESSSFQAFHEDFCKALSVALFRQAATVLVPVLDDASGYDALAVGDVDVVVGVSVSLQSLGQATHAFSTPTMYDQSGGAVALVTPSSDQEWSDFVNWIVLSLIYADSQKINASSAIKMPVVSLWGEELKQTLRDCVAGVGSYTDIFNRTLSTEMGSGRNRLNDWESPLHFPVPF